MARRVSDSATAQRGTAPRATAQHAKPRRAKPRHARRGTPRTFELERSADVSGVSGTGTVAEGVQWTDGTVALRWRGAWPTTTVWDDGIDAVVAVHGHHGASIVHWLDAGRGGTT
jgi:hypothetical protein